MNTKIVVDSSASLYTLQGVDFECVPLKIITDDAEYLDNGTMDALGMAQTLRTYKGKTSTSCPNVSDWLAAYEGADEVYAITITGTLSGSRLPLPGRRCRCGPAGRRGIPAGESRQAGIRAGQPFHRPGAAPAGRASAGSAG